MAASNFKAGRLKNVLQQFWLKQGGNISHKFIYSYHRLPYFYIISYHIITHGILSCNINSYHTCMKLTILCGWLVNGCELVHERSYVAAIFQQCFINYSLRECRLKFLASTTYIRLHQNHTCRTKYRKPHMVWGSLRLWWPLTFAIWQVFQEAYVTLETLALGSAMGADGSHVACYLGGLVSLSRAWRCQGFHLSLPQFGIFLASYFELKVSGANAMWRKLFKKKGIRPNNFLTRGFWWETAVAVAFSGPAITRLIGEDHNGPIDL